MDTQEATMTTLLEEPIMVTFTAHDRCDRCNAQAYIRAEMKGAKSDLLFCAHHGRKHEEALTLSGWTVRESVNIQELTQQPG